MFGLDMVGQKSSTIFQDCFRVYERDADVGEERNQLQGSSHTDCKERYNRISRGLVCCDALLSWKSRLSDRTQSKQMSHFSYLTKSFDMLWKHKLYPRVASCFQQSYEQT